MTDNVDHTGSGFKNTPKDDYGVLYQDLFWNSKWVFTDRLIIAGFCVLSTYTQIRYPSKVVPPEDFSMYYGSHPIVCCSWD